MNWAISVCMEEREKNGGKGAGTMTVKVIYLDASAALPYLGITEEATDLYFFYLFYADYSR